MAMQALPASRRCTAGYAPQNSGSEEGCCVIEAVRLLGFLLAGLPPDTKFPPKTHAKARKTSEQCVGVDRARGEPIWNVWKAYDDIDRAVRGAFVSILTRAFTQENSQEEEAARWVSEATLNRAALVAVLGRVLPSP